MLTIFNHGGLKMEMTTISRFQPANNSTYWDLYLCIYQICIEHLYVHIVSDVRNIKGEE